MKPSLDFSEEGFFNSPHLNPIQGRGLKKLKSSLSIGEGWGKALSSVRPSRGAGTCRRTDTLHFINPLPL